MSHHLYKVRDNDNSYSTHNTVVNYTTYSHYQTPKKK